MRTVLVQSVRTYARRYVAAVLAIVAGVSFVLVTATLSSATKSGMLSDLARSYPHTDAVVLDLTVENAGRSLAAASRLGTATVNADATVPVDVDGSRLTDQGAVGTVADAPSLRWQRLAGGTYPSRPGEALADAARAKDDGLKVGDLVTVGEGEDTATVRIVGLARSSVGPLAASVYLTWPDMEKLGGSVFVHDLAVGGASVADLRDAGLPPRAQVVSADAYLQEQAKALTRDVDAVASMLLVFAGIALFVSVLVIANTFTVLLAQRQRDFALLRCVGATRRQVMRSVRAEALSIGVAASSLGVVVGLLLGRLVVLGIDRFLPDLPTGEVHVGWGWMLAAWLVGVLVTFVASWFPAKRSTRVEPLAALRPLGAVDVRSRAGLARLGLGVLLIAGGVVLLGLAVATSQVLVMIAGGFASFFGLLLFGPVLIPACVRVAGLATGRLLGVPGRLAAANAVRNPRRTAATAASLLVGTTLVTAMVVGMSTIRDSVDGEMDLDHPLDATVQSAEALPTSVLTRVRASDGVSGAVALDGATVRVSGAGVDPATGDSNGKETSLGDHPLLGVPSGARAVVHGDPAFAHPPAGTAYLPWSVMNQLGDQTRVTLTHRDRTVDLRPVGTIGIDAILVSPGVLRQVAGDDVATRAVWARGAEGADADQVTSTLTAIARSQGADFSGSLKDRAYVDLQLDVMVYAVLALLSVALLIALLGIANTLGLSVLERGREHAMLRALGLTRGQLRGTLAVEAVLLAVVTSVIGVVLGSAYAWVGVRTVLDHALVDTGVSVHLPLGQLLLVVLVAAAAGLAACVLPARNAARVSPAAGLALD